MDNKTRIQNHNEIISDNNTSIDSLIEAINNLPEAGGGGSGKWQGFSALVVGFLADGGNYGTELLDLPIEIGKTYQITLGNEYLETQTTTFTVECVDEGLGAILNGPEESGFSYFKEWGMASFGLNYCMALGEGIACTVLTIQEV